MAAFVVVARQPPDLRGDEGAVGLGYFASAGADAIGNGAINNVAGHHWRTARRGGPAEGVTPEHRARLGGHRNQAFLCEENHLALAQNGGSDRRGLGKFVIFTLPDDVAVLFVKGEESFARAAARHENQIALEQWRRGASPSGRVAR